MRRNPVLLLAFTAAAFAGCNAVNRRIARHAAEFAALAPGIQDDIRHGVVAPDYTADMVYMALGQPDGVTTAPDGNTVWSYRRFPVLPYNESIQAGYLRRVVYDPVKRTNDIILEPIDAKAFPNLVPHTIRVILHQGIVVAVERTADR